MNGKLGLGTSVIALLALAGCHGHVHAGYYGGYYGGAYYVARPQPVVVARPAPAVVVGAPVSGSDGTFGWRVAAQAPAADVERLAASSARIGCVVAEAQPTEARAQCGGTEVLVRADASDVYRLCAAGTPSEACVTTWARIGP